MIRNLSAPKSIFIDRGSRQRPKESELLLVDATQTAESSKRGLGLFPKGSSVRSLKQQRFNDQNRPRKKMVRFALKRNMVIHPSSFSQCHWTTTDRHIMRGERSQEGRSRVRQERAWGYLPNLFKEIHIASYCPWEPTVADPFLAHLYKYEPERLLGLEKAISPWKHGKEAGASEASANFALRLGLSLEQSLLTDRGDPMMLDDMHHHLMIDKDDDDSLTSFDRNEGYWV